MVKFSGSAETIPQITRLLNSTFRIIHLPAPDAFYHYPGHVFGAGALFRDTARITLKKINSALKLDDYVCDANATITVKITRLQLILTAKS